MIGRLTVGIVCLLFAAEEFVRAGSAAAEVVRRPTELMDAILSGDGSVGPWLLVAYGALMLVRAWAYRPTGGGVPSTTTAGAPGAAASGSPPGSPRSPSGGGRPPVS